MQYGKTLISRQNLQYLFDEVFTNHLLDGQQLDNYNVFAIGDNVFPTPRESKRKGILLMLSREVGYEELQGDTPDPFFEMRVDLGGTDGRGKRIKIKRVSNATEAFQKLNSVYRVETQIHQLNKFETARDAAKLINKVWNTQYIRAHERAEYDGENPHFFDLSLWSSHYDADTKNIKKIVIGFTICKKNPNYTRRNVPTDNAPTDAETMELETAE